jgi:hypothetical protein
MRETLLFDTYAEMPAVLQKILAAYPAAKLIQEARGDADYFPVIIDLGLLDDRTWFEWSIDNGIFPYCSRLVVLLATSRPEWMSYIIESQRYKQAAKRLSSS